MALDFNRHPVSHLFDYYVIKPFTFAGIDYQSGDKFPRDSEDAPQIRLLKKLYEQRRITPRAREATVAATKEEASDLQSISAAAKGKKTKKAAKTKKPLSITMQAEEPNADEADGKLAEAADPVGAEKSDASVGDGEDVAKENSPAEIVVPEGGYVKPYSKAHKGFGKWDVVDANEVLVAKAISRDEANNLVIDNGVNN